MKRILYILALISLGSHAQYVQLGNKLVGGGAIGPSSFQGWSVSMSADAKTAIVGGSDDNNSIGACWIYTFNGTDFVQVGNKLVGSDYVGKPWQGSSVSISADGKTAVVGGYGDGSTGDISAQVGAVWVYTFDGLNFIQFGSKLVGTGNSGGSRQGYSASISADGKTIIAGGYRDNSETGATWIYKFNGNEFVQVGTKLVGSGGIGASNQGWSVGISGDGKTAIVGGSGDNNRIGATWIYTFNGTNYVQAGNKLVSSDYTGNGQGSAVSISLDGRTAIVGGSGDNNSIGATWIYTFNGSNYVQVGTKLVGSGYEDFPMQGSSVAISGNGKVALVSGWTDHESVGATWVFTFNGTVFEQSGYKLIGTGSVGNAAQGFSLSISADGGTAIIGGNLDNSNLGAAWMFVNTTSSCSVPILVNNNSSVSACTGSSPYLSNFVISSLPLNYQWYKNGTLLPSTAPQFSITSMSVSLEGLYTCEISNACGSVTSYINLSIGNSDFLKPIIGAYNNNLKIMNTITGTSYQWFVNNTSEAGQTTSIHTAPLLNSEYMVNATLSGCGSINSEQISIFKSIEVTTVTIVEVITATSCNSVNDNARMESPDNNISMDIDHKTGKLNVNAPSKSISKMEIADYNGKIISSFSQTTSIDLNDKPHGTYTIKALDRKGSILKMVKVQLQ